MDNSLEGYGIRTMSDGFLAEGEFNWDGLTGVGMKRSKHGDELKKGRYLNSELVEELDDFESAWKEAAEIR